MNPQFKDRYEAGVLLAFRLAKFAGCPDVLVLALPRGGVPVGHAVAQTLRLPLDVLLVRKLSVRGDRKVVLGAIAPDGEPVLSAEAIAHARLDPPAVAAIVDRERNELARQEQAYRGAMPPPAVRGHTIILVDDGAATGTSLRAAIQWLRHHRAGRIAVAIPVAAPEARRHLEKLADEVVVLTSPHGFCSVGREYRDFSEVTDNEVVQLLEAIRVGP